MFRPENPTRSPRNSGSRPDTNSTSSIHQPALPSSDAAPHTPNSPHAPNAHRVPHSPNQPTPNLDVVPHVQLVNAGPRARVLRVGGQRVAVANPNGVVVIRPAHVPAVEAVLTAQGAERKARRDAISDWKTIYVEFVAQQLAGLFKHDERAIDDVDRLITTRGKALVERLIAGRLFQRDIKEIAIALAESLDLDTVSLIEIGTTARQHLDPAVVDATEQTLPDDHPIIGLNRGQMVDLVHGPMMKFIGENY